MVNSSNLSFDDATLPITFIILNQDPINNTTDKLIRTNSSLKPILLDDSIGIRKALKRLIKKL